MRWQSSQKTEMLPAILHGCSHLPRRLNPRWRAAIELAERALRLSGGKIPMIFRILGAAYAENGAFPRQLKLRSAALN